MALLGSGHPACRDHGVKREEDFVLSPHAEAAFSADDSAGLMTRQTQPTAEALLDFIVTSLSDDKAEELVQIDLRGKTAMCDYMVIVSGRSTRQVSAMSEKLVARLKSDLGVAAKLEGKDAGDWVLIDTGDVIVHVFRPEVREFYQIEKMWLPQGAAS